MHHKPGQSFHCALQMPIDAHCCTSVLNSSVYFWIHYHLPLIFSSVLWLKKTKERKWRKWKKKQACVQRKPSKDLQRIWRTIDQNIFKNYTKNVWLQGRKGNEAWLKTFTQHQIHLTLPFLLNVIFLSNAVDTDCLQPVSWLLNVSI